MNKKTITFLTGNHLKWQIAQAIFSQYNVELLQEKFDTPEIQDLSVEEVAKFSVKYGSNLLGKPVIKNDVGYYIPTLNNFPGSFTKFANKWFSSDQVIALMENQTDRTLIIKDCIAFCNPEKEPITFVFENKCQIVDEPLGGGGTFDNIIIREGQNKVQSLYTPEEMLIYWQTHLEHYHELAKFIATS